MTALNVLIVDDQEQRHILLHDRLSSLVAAGKVRLLRAEAVQPAMRLLSSSSVDLLVVDLVLPMYETSGAANASHGELLLGFAADRSLCRSAPRVLGITSFDDASRALHDKFRDRATLVIDAPAGSTDWTRTIAEEVDRLIAQRADTPPFAAKAVVHAAQFESEFEAVLRTFHARDATPTLTQDTWQLMSGTPGDSASAVYGGWSPEMGVAAAAAMTVDAVLTLRPRFVLHVGICAGIAANARLGDVVIASQSWDGTSGKISEKDGRRIFQRTPHEFRTDPQLLRIAQAMNLSRDVDGLLPAPDGRPVHAHVAPIVTVGQVIAYHGIEDEVIPHHRKTVGLDMETYGIFRAANLSSRGPSPRVLVVKGVSDFADPNKSDNARALAAHNAALVAFHLLAKL